MLKIILLCFLFTSPLVHAGWTGDLHLGAGMGSAEVATDSESPDMTQFHGGLTLGYGWTVFELGLSFDYFMVQQTSDVVNSVGNRGGTRTNIASPTLGIKLLSILLKLDYQLSGSYTLDKATATGDEVSYDGVSGYRIYLGKDFTFLPGQLGLFYESVEYDTETTGSTEVTLSEPLTLSQYGLMYVLKF